MDLLGAWDYAVKDPDGVMGGKLPEAQAGPFTGVSTELRITSTVSVQIFAGTSFTP